MQPRDRLVPEAETGGGRVGPREEARPGGRANEVARRPLNSSSRMYVLAGRGRRPAKLGWECLGLTYLRGNRSRVVECARAQEECC